MSKQIEPSSELAKIAKLNGDFRKNYGMVIGAYLYLRSINASRPRPLFWACVIGIILSAASTWLRRHGIAGLHVG
jgi:hypothetical protein